MFDQKLVKKKREPSPPFSIKAAAIRQERLERIEKLTKDILGYLDKNKIDNRDAKPALRAAIDIVNSRTKLEK